MTWQDYQNSTFIPLFFNKDLSQFFPDASERVNAMDLCYKKGAIDPNPEERRECYYAYKVTGPAAASASIANKAAIDTIKTLLSKFTTVLVRIA